MENVPVILNQYRLGKTLGIGAFGKVKLGHHLITGLKVAVKILNKNKIKSMDMAEKVRREINILKMCTHPHIVRVYEVIDTPSDIFVIMEYVSNGELFDYIVSRGRLPADEARHLFHMIISGVEYCHYHNVVHRDLKPENLLLDSDNNVKIADFGLSNVIHDGDFLRTSCGSPNYAAPEVISGNLYAGAEVDVWSCGVILYALLCGTLPFDDESIPNLFKKIKSGMYSLPSHLSQLSRDLILRMLVVDPMKRITMHDIRQHPWFLHKLPAYLTLAPASIERRERVIDDEIVENVCALPLKGVTRELVIDSVMEKEQDKSISESLEKRGYQEIRVAYELLLDAKRNKQRIADVVLASQDMSSTPPAFSPRSHTSGVSGSWAQPAMHALSPSSASSVPRIDLGHIPRGPTTRRPQSSETQPEPIKRRRWYLGIQSKKDPAHVMTEVHKALLSLGCKWHPCTNYRVLCLWKHAELPSVSTSSVFRSVTGDAGHDDSMDVEDGEKRSLTGIKVALSLYKVQANIYLLDFQRIDGSAFGFMKLCASIITELKNLSAASRAQSQSQPNAQPSNFMGSSNPQHALAQATQQEQRSAHVEAPHPPPPPPPGGSDQMDTT